jgi:hypothetical protein
MQVLVIIVQNAVPHSELGVATSGATFFRSTGGSFGTAIFGAIFANVLVGNLAKHLHSVHLPAGLSSAGITPAVLSHLPAAIRLGFVTGYAESIQTVFIVAVPIAALAFLATWLIPQVELKKLCLPWCGQFSGHQIDILALDDVYRRSPGLGSMAKPAPPAQERGILAAWLRKSRGTELFTRR